MKVDGRTLVLYTLVVDIMVLWEIYARRLGIR